MRRLSIPRVLRRRTTRALGAVLAAALAGAALSTPAQAATSPASGTGGSSQPTCAGKRTPGVELSITSPRRNAVVNLAAAPSVVVTGRLEGAASAGVGRVDVYGDGNLVASAQLPSRRGQEVTWSTSVTPPTGAHSLVACVTTRNGQAASAVVPISVPTPPANATIVSPDAVVLSAQQQAAITSVTPTSVTTVGAAAVPPGKVLVSGVSDATPDGLLRRIVSETVTGTTTVYTTTDASLTDVFLQASLQVSGVPFEDVVPAAAAPAAAAARTAAMAQAAAVTVGKRVTVPLWDVSADETQSKSKTPKKNEQLTVTGSLALHEKMSSKADATLTLSLTIKLDWNGWTPTPHLSSLSLIAGGAYTGHAEVQATGSGKITYTATNFSPPHRFAAMEFQIGPVPVVIVPTVTIDYAAKALFDADATASVDTTGNFRAGVQYVNGQTSPVQDVQQNVKVVTPFSGAFKVSVSAMTEFDPKLSFLVDGVAGPDIGAAVGAEVSAALPTPCRLTGDVYANFSVGARVQVLDKVLLDKTFPFVEAKLPFVDEPLPLCPTTPPAPLVITPTMPAAVQGVPYGALLEATGGIAPYTWAATSISPANVFTVSANGTVAGTPTAPGPVTLQVTVTDSLGAIATGTVTFTVLTGKLQVTNTTINDGIVGISYLQSLSALNGTGPYTWSATGLPPGLAISSAGVITGTPTQDGSYPVTITVTDSLGAVATAALAIQVSTALPAPVGTGGVVPAPVLLPVAGVTGGSWGDPHLTTFDSATYDFQQVGEFVAVRSTTDDLEIQVRQGPFNGSRSIAANVAAAVKVGGHRLGIYAAPSGPRTLLDGAQITPDAAGTPLPGGGSVRLDSVNQRETVTWPDGSYLAADYSGGSWLSLFTGMNSARKGALRGLLGDADGSAANDLTPRSGTPLPYPGATTQQLYGAYSASWRLTPAESLFDYSAGETTATYTDTAFPYAELTTADLPAANRTAADAVCTAAGVTGSALDGCILDVAVTGQASVATAAATAQSVGSATTTHIWAWGDGHGGQLGTGASPTAPQLPGLGPDLPGPVSIAVGQGTSYAVTADGSVWQWGYPPLGIAGLADTDVPVRIPGMTGFVKISAQFGNVAFGLRSDGTVWAWGRNISGALGIGSTDPGLVTTAPVQVPGLDHVVDIASSAFNGYALRSDGSLWAWGDRSNGQVGDGVSQVFGSGTPPDPAFVPVRVPNLGNVIKVAAGGATYALTSDGTAWAWGSNNVGETGTGAPLGPFVSAVSTPTRISGLTGVVALGANSGNGYAVTGDGAVWAWGSGAALGTANAADSGIPVNVPGLPAARTVGSGGTNDAFVIDASGHVWAWGPTGNGPLGDAGQPSTGSPTPVEIAGIPPVSQLAYDYYTVLAITR